MGNIKDFQELWESQPKYSLMKILIYFFALLITAFLSIVVFKIGKGDHVKLLGFEINDNKDTVIPPRSDINNDPKGFSEANSLKNNALTKASKSEMPKKVNSLIHSRNKTIQPKQGDIKSKEVDTSFNIKYDLSHAQLSQSAVGNGAKVENYNGIKQRHFTDQDILSVVNDIRKMMENHGDWKHDIPITIAYGSDRESANYASELRNNLVQRGFNIVFGGIFTSGFININYEVTSGPPPGGYPLIIIYQAPNVK